MTLPPLPDAFRWTQEAWGAAIRCRPLEPHAEHLFTTRQLQLSSPDAERELAAAVGATRLAMATQVHHRTAVTIREGGPLPARSERADILISSAPDVAIAVRSADCVPLLIADCARGVVGAVHAGWRGTVAGAAAAGVEALSGEYGSRPGDLLVAIGPCIGACCYEVGPEIVDAFAAAGHPRHLIDRWFTARPPRRGSRAQAPLHLDLARANRDQLIRAGVSEERIFDAGLCTAMTLSVLTSFRAEQEAAGRLAAAIRARRVSSDSNPGLGGPE